MHYIANSSSTWGEHEIDYVFLIQADVDLDPNPNEVWRLALNVGTHEIMCTGSRYVYATKTPGFMEYALSALVCFVCVYECLFRAHS